MLGLTGKDGGWYIQVDYHSTKLLVLRFFDMLSSVIVKIIYGHIHYRMLLRNLANTFI